jgi:hypothetical protein
VEPVDPVVRPGAMPSTAHVFSRITWMVPSCATR